VQLLLGLVLGGGVLDVIMGIIALPAFIGFALLTVVFLHESDIQSRSLSSRLISHVEVVYLAVRTVVPLLFMLLSSAALIAFATFVMGSAIAFLFLWFVPYESALMNRLRTALVWIFVWATVTSQVSIIWYGFELLLHCLTRKQFVRNAPEKAGPIFMFLGGSPIVACVAVILVQVRLAYMHLCPLKQIKSPSEALVKLRMELSELVQRKSQKNSDDRETLLAQAQLDDGSSKNSHV
jgi:hypothetical protein